MRKSHEQRLITKEHIAKHSYTFKFYGLILQCLSNKTFYMYVSALNLALIRRSASVLEMGVSKR